MIQIEFPDGRVQSVEAGVTGSDIAKGLVLHLKNELWQLC